MFKIGQNKSPNNIPSEIFNEALRLWGKSIKKLTWEQIDVNNQSQVSGEIKTFHCPSGNACEMIEQHSFKYQENSHIEQCVLARCLSCDKIYWGKV